VHEARELLDRLIAAWRDSRDPALAEVIVRLGARVAAERGPLRGATKAELEEAWHALAATADSGDVDRLLAAPWPAAWRVALRRVTRLGGFAADPRIGRRLCEVASRYAADAAAPIHRAIALVLERAPDEANAVAIERLEAQREGLSSQAAYRSARGAIERASPPVSADAALLAEALAAAPATAPLHELWKDVWAHPERIAARHVLADALQARGDPRGEFIALQLAGGENQKAARRVAALLREHGDDWLGRLPGVERASRRFERGFVSSVRVAASDAQLEAALDADEWRTIEEIFLAASPEVAVRLVGRMPMLRALATPSEAVLRALAAAGPFPSLRALGGFDDWMPSEPMAAFPRLALVAGRWVVYWDAGAFRACLAAARALGLHAILFHRFPAHLMPLALTELAEAELPEVRFAFGERALESRFDVTGWRVALNPAARTAAVHFADSGSYATAALDLLGALVRADYRVRACLPQRARMAADFTAVEGASLPGVTFDGAPLDLSATPP
jgi:uncharacterized protein (TIGR02996 family)